MKVARVMWPDTEKKTKKNQIMRGLIFDIKRYAVHDGPGIRTTVFFKGCPLNCLWCHNPEGIKHEQEIMYAKDKCIKCGRCIDICSNGAHEIVNGEHIFDRRLCQKCGECTTVCLSDALQLVGKYYSVDEIIEEIQKDRIFYEYSNGGVTLSGGEPTFQLDFIKMLLKKCKELHLHTALDTCGYFKWQKFKRIIPYIDLILYDIKHLNLAKHKKYTGAGNKLILENLHNIVKRNIPVQIRMPLIPGINDSLVNIKNTAKFIADLGITSIEILSYHDYGISKYKRLGKQYLLADIGAPTQGKKQQVRELMNLYGLNVEFGES